MSSPETDAQAPTPAATRQSPEASIIDTVQSLIVAFVLAMTFRGFVTEGFVIPTGSMAPTLLGAHLQVHSDHTGAVFPVGLDQSDKSAPQLDRLVDASLGGEYMGSRPREYTPVARMGDRILVLKCLYPFAEPKRFDVVVFKNPTDPIGDAANYIKRLVGLPNEHIWLTDGDVFARPLDDRREAIGEFAIQRKPEHVQRAVWQPVFNSDLIPIDIDALNEGMRRKPYRGPPWVDPSGRWDIIGRREWSCTTGELTSLEWDPRLRQVDDWTAYNMLGPMSSVSRFQPVSDVRLSAAITARQAGLVTTFELTTRGHVMQWIIGNGRAVMRMRPQTGDDDWTEAAWACDGPSPGSVMNVEFWHVDQAMWMFINGDRIGEPLLYDWLPTRRLQLATGDFESDEIDDLIRQMPISPRLRWSFEGSPLTLHRVRLDRDLYYRHDMLRPRPGENAPYQSGHGFGTHPDDNAARLGPDHFMMLGDNSQMSLDSRLWGSPHPLIASQIDPAPFVVNRKLLLGKAWVVYFPAPLSLREGGPPVIPDFGRLRFIR